MVEKKDPLEGQKIATYLFAGFSVFLTLRLALHGSSFCLIRFQIPEHLFSLYVNRIHNSMQLLTLFGSAFGTAVIKIMKANETVTTAGAKEYLSIIFSISFFLINVVILIAFVTGGKNGCITFFYWSMAISSFIFSTNMQFILSMAGGNIVWYLASENSTQILTSFLHWILLFFYGNRRKHYTEYVVIVWQIVITILVTGVSAGLWTALYFHKAANALGFAGDAIDKLSKTRETLDTSFKNAVGKSGQPQGGLAKEADTLKDSCTPANSELGTLATNAGSLYDVITGSETAEGLKEQLGELRNALYAAADKISGCSDLNHHDDLIKKANALTTEAIRLASSGTWYVSLSPMAMCVIGLGMVFAFYPAIAPGMLVEFRLVHRVDLILLLVSPIPSVTIACMSQFPGGVNSIPARPWNADGRDGWHACHIFTIIEITCAILFIIALQYPKKWLSKSLRRPFWACLVSIMFYMSQEILAAVGYAGVEGNAGSEKETLSTVNNFLVRLSMIIFIFFAEGNPE